MLLLFTYLVYLHVKFKGRMLDAASSNCLAMVLSDILTGKRLRKFVIKPDFLGLTGVVSIIFVDVDTLIEVLLLLLGGLFAELFVSVVGVIDPRIEATVLGLFGINKGSELFVLKGCFCIMTHFVLHGVFNLSSVSALLVVGISELPFEKRIKLKLVLIN